MGRGKFGKFRFRTLSFGENLFNSLRNVNYKVIYEIYGLNIFDNFLLIIILDDIVQQIDNLKGYLVI